ncbi:unnamed protein product [Brassica rapa subsp. trilocularis]
MFKLYFSAILSTQYMHTYHHRIALIFLSILYPSTNYLMSPILNPT